MTDWLSGGATDEDMAMLGYQDALKEQVIEAMERVGQFGIPLAPDGPEPAP